MPRNGYPLHREHRVCIDSRVDFICDHLTIREVYETTIPDVDRLGVNPMDHRTSVFFKHKMDCTPPTKIVSFGFFRLA